MSGPSSAVRVVKLGGSLLQCADLCARLQKWFAQQSAKPSLIVVGGGELANTIRKLDQRFQIDPAVCHQLAIETMAINSRLVASLWPDVVWVEEIAAFVAHHPAPSIGIVNPITFMVQMPATGKRVALPPSWAITSDSIAAFVASAAGANELVLLKSCLPTAPPEIDIDRAAAIGYVDEFFSRAARGIATVRAVNLRARTFPELELSS